MLFRTCLQVFLKDGDLYAFKGLAGRFAPIGVHISMLLIMAGVVYGGFGGFKGTAMVPEVQSGDRRPRNNPPGFQVLEG